FGVARSPVSGADRDRRARNGSHCHRFAGRSARHRSASRLATFPAEDRMNGPSPSSLLRPVLRLFGLIFIFGIPLFNRIWPSGWAWAPEQPAHLQLNGGIYATLGVVLLLPAPDPARHLSPLGLPPRCSIRHGPRAAAPLRLSNRSYVATASVTPSRAATALRNISTVPRYRLAIVGWTRSWPRSSPPRSASVCTVT